jgi:hypothetical protein
MLKPTMKSVLLALLLRPTQAQLNPWVADQINASICTWTEPRGIISQVHCRQRMIANGRSQPLLSGIKSLLMEAT